MLKINLVRTYRKQSDVLSFTMKLRTVLIHNRNRNYFTIFTDLYAQMFSIKQQLIRNFVPSQYATRCILINSRTDGLNNCLVLAV